MICLSLTTHTKVSDTDPRPRDQIAQGPQQTRPCTPNSRLSLFQQTLLPSVPDGATSPDGGINLRSCEPSPVSTSTGFPRLSTAQPTSPTVIANTRVRRSEYGSFLLQSPARAGHATQMRRIFKDANHTFHGSQQPRSKLYPQLPNISRKASPPPVRDLASLGTSVCRSPKYRPESLCLSTKLLSTASQRGVLQVSQGNQSEASAGSWSNDSGYIVTGSRDRRSEPTIPSKDRILDWICGISEGEADVNCENSHEEVSVTIVQQCEEEEREASLVWPHRKHAHPLVPQGQSKIDDPFLSHSRENNTITSSQIGSGRRSPTSLMLNHCVPSHFSDTCRTLDFDSHKENNQPLPEAKTEATTPLQYSVKTTPIDYQDLEEGGIQLSPNVCVERGPSRHHSPRKPHNAENTLTPSKRSYNTPFPAGRLKENVITGKEAPPHLGSPLTPRSNLVGTRFRRAQQTNQTLREN